MERSVNFTLVRLTRPNYGDDIWRSYKSLEIRTQSFIASFVLKSKYIELKMKLFVILVLANLSAVLSAPPVFLESAGSKICTLNKVGKVPTGTAITYPVYQKVCRKVIPRLGDEVSEDEMSADDETVTSSDDEMDLVRRAILGKSK